MTGLIITVAATFVLNDVRSREETHEYQLLANAPLQSVEHALIRAVASVSSTARLVASSDNVTQAEFTIFTSEEAGGNAPLESVFYAPAEKTADGLRYPIDLVQPVQKYMRVIETDLLAVPEVASAIQAALSTGRTAITQPSRWLQRQGQQPSIFIVVPTYRQGSVSANKPIQAIGFIIGQLRIEEAVRTALATWQETHSAGSARASFSIIDVTDPDAPVAVYPQTGLGASGSNAAVPEESALSATHHLQIGDRAWLLNVTTNSTEMLSSDPAAAIAAGAGLGATILAMFATFAFRRRAQESRIHTLELQHIIDRFEEAQDLAQFGTWDHDLVTGSSFLSGGLRRMLGIGDRGGEENADALVDTIHADDRARVVAVMAAMANGSSDLFRLRYRHQRSDGEWRVLAVTVRKQQGSPSQNPRILGLALDVTEEERARLDLVFQERAIEVSASPIGMSDLAGKLTYVNAAMVRFTGYSSPDELIGRSGMDFWHEPDSVAVREGINRDGFWRGDIKAVRADGSLSDVDAMATLVRDADDRQLGYIMTYTDLTARNEARLALEARERALRQAQEMGRIGGWNYEVQTDSLTLSLEARQLLELQADAAPLPLQRLIDLVHRDHVVRIRRTWDDIMAGETSVADATFRFMVPSGSEVHIRAIWTSISNEGGNVIRVEGVLQDVTQTTLLHQQLVQAQKMEAVGQLTGGISHDFNNLLTVILGNADELQENLDGHLGDMARMVRDAALRAADLTHRLLAFSRKQALAPTTVDVNELLTGLEPLMARALGGSISLKNVGNTRLWKAKVDSSQLENAILNLAINARDAMPGGGSLTIEASNIQLDQDYLKLTPEAQCGQYIVVTVSDTGTGMPPDVVEKAFEPFFTTKGIGMGSGLGLSMVYGFVKQSGGHVKIYSEMGEGTSIKIYLPRADREGVVQRPAHRLEALPRGTERLALVEDDILVRPYIEAALVSLGYTVNAFQDGTSLLRAMDDGLVFDLLVTDVILPSGMNGRMLADKVQDRRPGNKVIFISGYTENAIVHHGRLDAGVHLLQKPFRKFDLAHKLRAVLEGS